MSAQLRKLVTAVLQQRVVEPDRGWLDAALQLVVDVRDDPTATARALSKLDDTRQLEALCVVLAALVPDDKPVAQLTSWLRQPFRRNQHTRRVPNTRSWTEQELRRAHSRYNSAAKRARLRGVEFVIDERTREGEREYNRRRKERAA